MTTELEDRLSRALKKRAEIEANLQRLKGKQEAAQKNLEAVEAECRLKNIEPSTLSTLIQNLQERFEREVLNLETQVQQAEQAIMPYLGE